MYKITYLLLLWILGPAIILAQGAAGALDSTYNGTGIVYHKIINDQKTSFQKVRLQPDGKSVAFGYTATGILSEQRTTVTRFNTDGTPDSSFGVNGNCVIPGLSSQSLDGHILPDGSILAASTVFFPNSIAFSKIRPNGIPDSTFGVNGVIRNNPGDYAVNLVSSNLLPDGKIVVVGYYFDLNVSLNRALVGRFLPTGKPDSTFGVFGYVKIDEPSNLLVNRILGGDIQPDGKIMITGAVGQANIPQQDDWLLIRLNPDGSLDQGFGNGGKVRISLGVDYPEGCYSLIFLPDGKFLGGGYAHKFPGFHFTVARFNNNGTLDPTYGFGGKTQIGMNCCNSSVLDMEQQADGKVVACGYASKDGHVNDFAIARFKENGAVDQTFGASGRILLRLEPDTSQLATSLVIQTDNKILVTGYNTKVDEYAGVGLMVRLNPGTITVVGTDIPENTGIDEILLQPNPVAGNTLELKYTLQTTSPVTMDLYDLTGRKISSIFEKATRFEGDNQESVQLPADLPQGQYYLRMMTETGFVTMKFVKL